ncbi:microcephalin isoform X3 [Strigops habroptila]|uniref:microcephalin isoform X3 n=1 Tax=Strigops habroptila TaxID=2489341 RepID=UPI0011CF6C80|nr:microcephalin isoform X3 [Strigops habroptila]
MEPVLKDISAFVEVWSSNRTENYSETFEQQLLDMGAKVSKTLNKHVTHVVFKDGHLATWRKAQKLGVKIVSVLWVEKCRETRVHVDESLFPAVVASEELPQPIKKHKCMQPKDFVEKTPENDRKLQRRLDQMAKELAIQKIAVNAETDVPVLLFEDNGSLVYSPVNKVKDQHSAMERRIKEMKEKRENISPTASQMSQILPSSSPGDCLLPTCVLTNSEDALLPGEQMKDCLNSSFCLWGIDKLKRQKTEVIKPACDSWTDTYIAMSASGNSPSQSYAQTCLTPKQCSRRSLRKKQLFQRTLDDKLPLGKKDLKKFPNKNQDENSKTTSVANESSLLQIKGLGHLSPSKKMVKLNTVAAMMDSLSNSPPSNGDLNKCSLDTSFPVYRNNCILKDKKRKKLEILPSLKLATSELGASGSKEFLQADTTGSKSFGSEEASYEEDSYEDFFSSFNFNESEVQIKVPKESQNLPEVCCKDAFASMDSLDVSFCKPCSTSKKSGKRSVSANDLSVKKNLKPAEHPGSVPLNYMSDGEKADTAEALDSDDVNRLPQHAHEKSYRTNVNYSTYSSGDENQVSECHVTDGSCRGFNEQKNKNNGGLRKKRRLQKPTRTLVMTSTSSEKQNTVIQVVNKLRDFLFSDDVCETTSHVVTGSPRRTLNVMLGIARGCWIVSYEWVLWSLELGHCISEEPYELSSSFPAAPQQLNILSSATCFLKFHMGFDERTFNGVCRLQHHLSTGKYQQNLFSNQPVMFVSPTSQPPCKKLIELIQLSGGKVCKALHQAKICIGKNPGKKYQEIKCLSEKWILDSITQHAICLMENYIFQL